jgi:choline dehydrogenase-like flavoprotein
MQLTQAGMRVLMLEAGSPVDPARDFHHTFLYQMDYRGQGKPGLSRKYSGSERNYRIMIDNSENPYTTSPETVYHWGRSRVAERFTGRAPVTAWPITNSMRPHAMAMAWTGR